MSHQVKRHKLVGEYKHRMASTTEGVGKSLYIIIKIAADFTHTSYTAQKNNGEVSFTSDSLDDAVAYYNQI